MYEAMSAVGLAGRRRSMFTALATAGGVRRGDRVLDVGCGTGYFARVLSDAVGPQGQVVGIDASEQMIAFARRRARRLPTCGFEVALAQDLGQPDGAFDVVVSSLMMHHLPDEARPVALSEMYRVLRPGGRLLIADYETPTGRLPLLALHVMSLVPFQNRSHRRESHDHRAMEHSHVAELVPTVAGAGFADIRQGAVRSWMRYVTAIKPDGGVG
jgi:ubiquinone/menaquinone biosynthesis C-methylase UbiE